MALPSSDAEIADLLHTVTAQSQQDTIKKLSETIQKQQETIQKQQETIQKQQELLAQFAPGAKKPSAIPSTSDPEEIASRVATVKAQFHRIATEKDGVKMVPLKEAVGLLTPMGLPHGRKTKKLLKSFDADGNGMLDINELDNFLQKAVIENLEADSAIKMATKMKKKKGSNFSDAAKAQAGHDPTQLKKKLTSIIEKHSDALKSLNSDGDAQIANIHGIISKLGNDLLNPPPPQDNQSCEEWLTKTVIENGWKWTVAEYKKDVPFGDFSTGRLPDTLSEALEKGAASLESASAKWGPGFDQTMELYANNIMGFCPEVVDEKQLLELEDPAIMAFSFGTGGKIGPAKDMPTLVGPGCETPGLMNVGLAQSIKKILAVRPMPVFSQWEIADALCFGEQGSPEAMHESFFGWDFEDALPDGEKPGEVPNPYPRVGSYEVEGGTSVPVYRALPIWPKAEEQGLVKREDLKDAATIKKFYLSTGGVLQQSKEIWMNGLDKKPKTVVIVGHPDHRMRCGVTTQQLVLKAEDGTSTTLGIDKIVIPSDKFYDDWTKYKCDTFAYDPTSTQPWTTKRPFFLATEAALRNWLFLRGDYGPNPFQGAPRVDASQVNSEAALISRLASKQMMSMLQPSDQPEDDDE